VAVEAVARQDRPHVAGEIDVGGAGRRCRQEKGEEGGGAEERSHGVRSRSARVRGVDCLLLVSRSVGRFARGAATGAASVRPPGPAACPAGQSPPPSSACRRGSGCPAAPASAARPRPSGRCAAPPRHRGACPAGRCLPALADQDSSDGGYGEALRDAGAA
jgi:hypothetical protein